MSVESLLGGILQPSGKWGPTGFESGYFHPQIGGLHGAETGGMGGGVPGRTYEGRPVVQNPDGSWSHERSITIEVGGKHLNIPTMFGGKQVTPDKAVEILRKNKWIDPDNGRKIPVFDSAAEALKAAQEKERLQQQLK